MLNRKQRVTKLLRQEQTTYDEKADAYGDAIGISAQVVNLYLQNIPDERIIKLIRNVKFLEVLGTIYRVQDKFVRPIHLIGNTEINDLGEKASRSATDGIAYIGILADSLIQLEESLKDEE